MIFFYFFDLFRLLLNNFRSVVEVNVVLCSESLHAKDISFVGFTWLFVQVIFWRTDISTKSSDVQTPTANGSWSNLKQLLYIRDFKAVWLVMIWWNPMKGKNIQSWFDYCQPTEWCLQSWRTENNYRKNSNLCFVCINNTIMLLPLHMQWEVASLEAHI